MLLTHVAFRTGETGRGAGGAVLARFDAGVAVFFVLSGFLLYGSPAGSAVRAAPGGRILPAYWVVVAVAAVFWLVPATHWWLGQTYLGPLAGAADPDLVAVRGDRVLRGAARAGRAGPALGVAAAVGARCSRTAGSPRSPARRAASGLLLWLPGHLDWFAVGMAVAAVARRGCPWLARLAAWPGTCWAAAGALLFLLSSPIAGPLTLAPVPGAGRCSRRPRTRCWRRCCWCRGAGPQRGCWPQSRCGYLGRVSTGSSSGTWSCSTSSTGSRWADFSGRMLAVALLTGLFSVAAGLAVVGPVERPALRLADRVAARVARRPPAGQRGGEQAERDRTEAWPAPWTQRRAGSTASSRPARASARPRRRGAMPR